jgi:hypothetical protein
MPGPHATNQPDSDGPTPKQLHYLRSLANSRGQTFTYPLTKAQASREIRRLLANAPDDRLERAVEHQRLDRDVRPPMQATQVREAEITGYGANARWNRKERS